MSICDGVLLDVMLLMACDHAIKCFCALLCGEEFLSVQSRLERLRYQVDDSLYVPISLRRSSKIIDFFDSLLRLLPARHSNFFISYYVFKWVAFLLLSVVNNFCSLFKLHNSFCSRNVATDVCNGIYDIVIILRAQSLIGAL